MKKLIVSTAFSLCAFGAAQAATVTYDFTGTLAHSNISSAFPAGQQFSGFISFDSATPDSLPGQSNIGLYNSAPAISITLGGYTVSTPGAGSTGFMRVFDQMGGVNDSFWAETSVSGGNLVLNPGPYEEVYSPARVLLSLGNTDGTAFSSDALPTSGLNLALFDNLPNTFVEIQFDKLSALGYTYPLLIGRFDSLALRSDNAVPEPSGLALLGIGLAGLAALRQRKI